MVEPPVLMAAVGVAVPEPKAKAVVGAHAMLWFNFEIVTEVLSRQGISEYRAAFDPPRVRPEA